MTTLEERQQTVALIDEAVAKKALLSNACTAAGIDRRTYRRWKDRESGEVVADARPEAVRPTPRSRLSKEERELILLTCQLPRFADLPPSQIVPTLADEGLYIGSESSFYRVLHEAQQQHERGRARRRSSAVKTSHETTGINQCWCWDVTYLASPVIGLHYYLYMIVDIWSRKIVGWEVYEKETGELASELMRRAVLAEQCNQSDLILHADNGGPQRSSTLRATLDKLGVRTSFSRPRVSDDNSYSESLFRTIKYRHDFPSDGFASIEAARKWVLTFVTWYNEEHHHGSIRFVSPKERHEGRDNEILDERKRIHEDARQRNPSRWSGKTRTWARPEVVWLNPGRESGETKETIRKAA